MGESVCLPQSPWNDLFSQVGLLPLTFITRKLFESRLRTSSNFSRYICIRKHILSEPTAKPKPYPP